MGDVAMTVPVIRAFTQQYPEVKLTILTRPFFKPFFRDLDNVEVFPVDLKKTHKGVFGLYKLSKQLKQLGIDAVADLHNVLRTKILKAFFTGTTFKQINKGRSEKKALVKGDIFKPLKTTHQRYTDVFNSLGFPVDLSNPSFPKSIPLSKKEIAITGKKTRKWIGVAPFAAHKSKMYPLSKMKNVIATLSKDYTIYLFGSKQEAETLEDLKTENTVNLAGKLTLNEELNIISNLDVMISMDSGNAHIAAMLGIKVVTIWGVTHPFAGFAPFNQPEQFSITLDKKQFPLIPTSVYGNKFPEEYKDVAKYIKEDDVINVTKSIV